MHIAIVEFDKGLNVVICPNFETETEILSFKKDLAANGEKVLTIQKVEMMEKEDDAQQIFTIIEAIAQTDCGRIALEHIMAIVAQASVTVAAHP